MDKATLEVRAVESSPANATGPKEPVDGSGVGDAPVSPDPLAQIPEGEPIASVAAGGAYDARGCRDAIANRSADAVVPPRRNAQPWKKDSLGAAGRNEALRAIGRLGRTIWRRWSGHRRKSRAATEMNGMKRLGQKLMARDLDRRTAELQVRIAVLNRFTAHGIPVTQPIGRPRQRKGEA